MAKLLMREDELDDCVSSRKRKLRARDRRRADESCPDQAIDDMLWDIVSVQTHQIRVMEEWLSQEGYALAARCDLAGKKKKKKQKKKAGKKKKKKSSSKKKKKKKKAKKKAKKTKKGKKTGNSQDDANAASGENAEGEDSPSSDSESSESSDSESSDSESSESEDGRL